MVDHFGPGILHDDGTLDRQAVADIVFTDDDQLAALNAIVHPGVGKEIDRRIEEQRDTEAVVVLDVPLLVESKAYTTAGTIVVDTDLDIAVTAWCVPGLQRGGRPSPHGPSGHPRRAPGRRRLRHRQRRNARRARAADRGVLVLDPGPGGGPTALDRQSEAARAGRSDAAVGSARWRTARHSSSRGYMAGTSSGRMRLSLAR